MKKVYTKPELEILVLDSQDIIVMSYMSSNVLGPAEQPGDNVVGWDQL